MKEEHHALFKKIIRNIIMTCVTAIVGFILNHIIHTVASSISYHSPMNTYEHQINNCIINPTQIQETLDSVGGLDDIKEDIKANILLPLQYPHLFFSNPTLMPSRGILLYGPPGTGKTLLARAIAHEAHVPFISLSLASLENKYYGESSKLIQGAFSLAHKIQPCIVFFDEIDGLLRKRSDMDQSATYGMKTELLAQIDGISSKQNDSLFVIGTTNNLSSLDPAIRRRLPKVYEVSLPKYIERYQILRLKLSQEAEVDEELIKWMAKGTHGFSGSDINDLVRQSRSIRLKEYCNNVEFQQSLKNAKTMTDLPNLCPLQKSHVSKALSENVKFKDLIQLFVKEMENEANDADCEEAPPTLSA
jgi:ATPase family AAA domain-containing protein 1